ncbi:MAG: CotH kinase family protein [Saprospiraceae bacterium]
MLTKKEYFFIGILLIAILAISPFYWWKERSANQSTLPRVVLTATPKDIFFQENQFELSYYDQFQNLYLDQIPTAVRIRGNTSAFLEKKHYGLTLPRAVAIAGLPKSKNWLLIASHLDMTFMRNTLSYDLYAAFSPGNRVPRTAYTTLYFGEAYHGLYVLTQRVDARSLGLERRDPFAVLYKEPPINRRVEEHEEQYAGFRNYILKHSRFDVYSQVEREKIADKSYFNQRYPKLEKENRANEIYELTDYIFNTSDSIFTSEKNGIQQIFDLDNLIDWQLLLLISNNGDGVVKNFYLYRINESGKYKICPWDYDHGYGRDGDAEPRAQTAVLDCTRLKLFERLMQLNPVGYNQRLRDKFLALKAKGTLTTDQLFARMDQIAEQIRPAVLANQARWPLGEDHPFLKGADFDSEVQRMKDWITRQLPMVEAFLVEALQQQ